jgi:hypothetical protein
MGAYEAHTGCPPHQNPRLPPRTPDIALPRICINTAPAGDALLLPGYINPSCSVDRGTRRLLLQLLQFLPIFAVDTSLTPYSMICLVLVIAWHLPAPVLVPPAPGATDFLKCPTPLPIFSACTLSIACSSALPAAQGAILFPNNVIHCAC